MDSYRSSGSSGDLDILTRMGGHAVLSGLGGDQFGSAVEVVEDMIATDPIDFLLEALLPSYLTREQRVVRLRLMLRSIVPVAIRRELGVRRLRTRLPKWLRKRWNAVAGDILRKSYGGSEVAFPDSIRRARWKDLNAGSLGLALDLDQRAASLRGAEFRYPFLDRDLVSAMLSIPTDFWPRPQSNARVHRRALSSFLPPVVANRRSKARFNEPFARRLRRNRESLRRMFHEGEWASDQYVDRAEARLLLARAFDSQTDDTDWMTWRGVWGIATLEAWLRRVSDYNSRREERIDD